MPNSRKCQHVGSPCSNMTLDPSGLCHHHRTSIAAKAAMYTRVPDPHREYASGSIEAAEIGTQEYAVLAAAEDCAFTVEEYQDNGMGGFRARITDQYNGRVVYVDVWEEEGDTVGVAISFPEGLDTDHAEEGGVEDEPLEERVKKSRARTNSRVGRFARAASKSVVKATAKGTFKTVRYMLSLDRPEAYMAVPNRTSEVSRAGVRSTSRRGASMSTSRRRQYPPRSR